MDSDSFIDKWKSIVDDVETEFIEKTIEGTYGNNIFRSKTRTANKPLFYLANDKQEEDLSENSRTLSGNEKYTILEMIAQGGMGTIHKGHQVSLARSVAIKKMLQRFTHSEHKVRFVAESKITAFLDHPNIVPVYDLGETKEGDIILVMKLVGGTSWKDLLKKDRAKGFQKNDLEKHLRILLNVCNAIIYAHSKGIIHNDLKPENIMVGEFGEVYVMDWGIAATTKEGDETSAFLHVSEITDPMGTPCYMAPELASGEGNDMGPWTDVYLLGSILYEILTGRPPNKGNNILAILHWMSIGGPLEFPAEVLDELQQICRKALAQEKEKRYQGVIEFKAEIENFLLHQESIFITQRASKLLVECEGKGEAELSSAERNQFYDDFAQTIASFHQALDLWEENKVAAQGEIKARFAYGKAALKNEDFGLVEAQLVKLEALGNAKKEAKYLIDGIKAAKVQKAKVLISQRLTLISVLNISICLVGVLDLLTASFRDFHFMAFYLNPFQIWLFGGGLLGGVLIFLFINKRQNSLKELGTLTLFYQISAVFLASFMFFGIEISETAQANGVFISVFCLALFPVLTPFNKLMAWIGSLGSLAMIFVALIISQKFGVPLPPKAMLADYFIQHFIVVILVIVLITLKKEEAYNLS